MALNLHDRVPSVFNGGVGNVRPTSWIAAVASAALAETLIGSVDEIQSSPSLRFFSLRSSQGGRERVREESETLVVSV